MAPGSYLLSWRWDCEESTQVWQNCADVELVATASEAEWHLASAEALARVPKPEKAAAAKFDPYKDATGDENFDCDKQVAYCEKVNYKASQFKCGKDEASTRAEVCPKFEKTSGAGYAKPALAMLASTVFAVEVLGLEDPGWLRAFAVASAAVIAAVFQPPSAFERIAQPFLPRVPVYLRDKT